MSGPANQTKGNPSLQEELPVKLRESTGGYPPIALECLSIDLEVGVKDGRIHQFAAVRGRDAQAYGYRGGHLTNALTELDAFGSGCRYLLGHNLIAFDLNHIAATNPALRLLDFPPIDTLRLNPLAFPRNPYHHLVKHYQDGKLSVEANDPENDARLTLDVLRDQYYEFVALRKSDPSLLVAWHWLTTFGEGSRGFDALFSAVREQPRPSDAEAKGVIEKFVASRGCQSYGRALAEDAHVKKFGWPLAYALAWLSVCGGNSVMPPWVRHQFPEAGELVQTLRDTACGDASCAWCGDRHSATKELARWFKFPGFRPEPMGPDGVPLQQAIVEAAMRREHVLGILPTGTGKSVCYQVPALSRYDKTGALTVVVSPLVALMADQVAGMERTGITCCAAINGLLSLPERADVLDRIRLGDVGIVIVSPEQLRNRSVRGVLAQREIGAWVLDEAHCVSKWGHDFRPDYRYVARFIKEKAGDRPVPPVLCLTATAKPDVINDIVRHFHDKVGIDLKVFDGGASRDNLQFSVIPTSPAEKLAHIAQILAADLRESVTGGAIVYCATRRKTQEIAEFLRAKSFNARHFHAGLQPETKKEVQEDFIRGSLRVIVATNAFGMGIDKPDVRVVIHADIPGSLENYLQEAGRAGRDRMAARCILLYTKDDVERQFGMSARSRLKQHEIQAILKSLRAMDRKKRLNGEVVATSGEILTEETEGDFERDSATDDTRVRTAISWLEEAELLLREENQVQIFPSSLRVSSIEDARRKLEKTQTIDEYRRQLLKIVTALIQADPDDGISTDELMLVSGLSAEKVRKALFDLEAAGLASNDTAITAFVHVGVEKSSLRQYEAAGRMEASLIGLLREMAPDMSRGGSCLLHLRHATQRLKDAGHTTALMEHVWRIVRSLSMDGRGDEEGIGSARLQRFDTETVQFTLQREWSALEKTAQLRRDAGLLLLNHLVARLPSGAKGVDLLAETTLGKLLQALESDIVLTAQVKEKRKLLERGLLWLHEQGVIKLNKGLAVFRPAMTIHLAQDRRRFDKNDFAPLRFYYDEQVIQIHVMAEYAQRGLQAMADAIRLAMDYFSLEQDSFLSKWMPEQRSHLGRQTTAESWRIIVEELRNPVQQRIVTDDREKTNVLVLAGPGSGKTRVLVHRIAYLIRVRRENPRGILALAYNRHAAVQIRRRLTALIGDDAKGVTVMTCHALAMRVAGVSFVGRVDRLTEDSFREVLQQAVDLLRGNGLPPEEADEQRDRLLAGFRWILVDEYQDIGPEQYELISAMAGRTLPDEDGKLSLLAVGDDDQNIYAFDGASVEFIRRFEQDYAAKPTYLTENYRSTAHIISAANAVIAPARHRMKVDHPITIDKARRLANAGGEWQRIDRVGQGRVQVIAAGDDMFSQAVAVMAEFERMARLEGNWDWSRAAIISREWKFLEPIRAYCELSGIPVQMAFDEGLPVWRIRETQALVAWLRNQGNKIISPKDILAWLEGQTQGPWWGLLHEATEAYELETGSGELPTEHFIEWLAEWGREFRRRQTGLLLLTAHRAKGLEFDHVAVLDGSWDRAGEKEDADAPRRLYYVAMTRARRNLMLAKWDRPHRILGGLMEMPCLLWRDQAKLPLPDARLRRRYLRLPLDLIDMGYPGRHRKSHPMHKGIADLAVNDALELKMVNDAWLLHDAHGLAVGRMAHRFALPEGMQCIEARVAAILRRRKEDNKPEFQHLSKCDDWEFIVPELVLAYSVPGYR